MANLATVDKIFETHLVSAKAAVDAIIWLSRSREMPTPTIREGDWKGVPSVILSWQGAPRGWIRVWFVGDGKFDWIAIGEPHDCIEEGMNTSGLIDDGAPQAVVDYIKFLMLEMA